MKNRFIFFIVLAFISFIDGLLSKDSGLFQLLLSLASSLVVFYMPYVSLRLKKLPLFIIFLINSGILAVSYFVYNNVLLINMLILSYFIWRIITPPLVKMKYFLPVTFIITFLSVYAASFLDFSVPLYIFVFYPVYSLSSLVQNKNLIKTKKIWFFCGFNVIFSGILLLVFIFKSLGLLVIDSILFLNIAHRGTITGMYLPFIALAIAWFGASSNLLLLMPFSKFIKGQAAFDLSTYIKPVINFISYFAVASFVTFICEYSIRQDIDKTVRVILDPNILFNILILSSIYLCLISLVGKGIANIILAIFTLFLSLANYIKITYFNEPFYPWDLYLIQNLIGISKEYINVPILLLFIAAIMVAVFLLVRYRARVIKCLKPRISWVMVPFALLFFFISTNILTTKELSSQIGIMKSWYIGKDEILTNGMFAQNYFYIDDLDKYLNPKPENYDEQTMLSIDKKYAEAVNTSAIPINTLVEKPNVVVIMSESFWDITKLKGITYSKDIAENVHLHQKGQIVAPIIGGGTANTEFEALTGMSMSFLSPGIVVYNAYLRTKTPSVASILKSNGYKTTAIHPNNGWFYNRDKVYNYLGFDQFIDLAGFNMKTQLKGSHISDDALVDVILNTLNTTAEPSFIFAVSIENHDPYLDKYKNLDVDIQSELLDSTQKNIVSNYAQGIYDADQSFGRLIEELGKSDKPTLVYFFGDHAPRLGSLEDYYKIYDMLGTDDRSTQNQGLAEKLKYFTTPFSSWSNYREMPELSSIMSPSHITYEILKDTGVKYPNYINVLSKLKNTYPVMHLQGMGQIDQNDELVKDYSLIQYDLLFGKKYLN